jgi:hypothetical protein
VWLKKEHPAAAKVTVLRGEGRFPAVALWDEYVALKRDGSVTQMWANKGALMLAKCAEALALRKAFPQDLSGIYTSDEMAQADNRQPPTPRAVRPVEAVPDSDAVVEAEPVDPDDDPGLAAGVEEWEIQQDCERFEQLIDGATTAREMHEVADLIATSKVHGEPRERLRLRFSARMKELGLVGKK